MSHASGAPLFAWPESARFGRRVAKDKFAAQGVSAQVKAKLTSEVQRITWAYKLAESTINLSGSEAVPEIQVFELEAKDADVSNTVLTAIDKTIHFPVIFEVSRAYAGVHEVRLVAGHKALGTGAPKVGPLASTLWFPSASPRAPLPGAVSLAMLYAALLQRIADVSPRAAETPTALALRLADVARLEREVTALTRKMATEKQFNRKVELRRTLLSMQAQLDQLR